MLRTREKIDVFITVDGRVSGIHFKRVNYFREYTIFLLVYETLLRHN